MAGEDIKASDGSTRDEREQRASKQKLLLERMVKGSWLLVGDDKTSAKVFVCLSSDHGHVHWLHNGNDSIVYLADVDKVEEKRSDSSVKFVLQTKQGCTVMQAVDAEEHEMWIKSIIHLLKCPYYLKLAKEEHSKQATVKKETTPESKTEEPPSPVRREVRTRSVMLAEPVCAVETVKTEIHRPSSRISPVVNLTKQNLIEVPSALFTRSDVTALRASLNNLKSIPADVGNWKLLKELSLQYNQLTSLPAELAQLASLSHIGLSGNEFSEHSPFEPMFSGPAFETNVLRSSITKLEMDFCHICNVPPEISFFGNLRTLQLANNSISAIDGSVFIGLSKLDTLELQHNNLVELPEEIGHLVCLTKIDVSHNRLKSVPKALYGLPSLNALSLSWNQLETIESDSVANSLQLLRVLLLDHNRLRTLPKVWWSSAYSHDNQSEDCIKGLPRLRGLDLSHNKLDSSIITERLLFCITSVEELVLSCNRFEWWDVDISSLTYLRELNLSNNDMKDIPKGISQCNNLESINMSFNDLSSCMEIVLPPSIQSLVLGYCKLKPSCHLDVTGRNLTEVYLIGNDVQVEGLESLKTVHNLNGKQLLIDENLSDDDQPYISVSDRPSEVISHISNPRVKDVSTASMLGKRAVMEDAIVIHQYSNGISIFGIFDGHASDVGARWLASEFISTFKPSKMDQRRLNHPISCIDTDVTLSKISANLTAEYISNASGELVHDLSLMPDPQLDKDSMVMAISSAYLSLHAGLAKHLENVPFPHNHAGSTALVVALVDNLLYCSNAGDTRCVLYSGGRSTRLSFDHKPYDAREELRIRHNGGCVYPNGRLMNNISVCRGIGDNYLGAMVSASPFVSIVDLNQLIPQIATTLPPSNDMSAIEEAEFLRRLSINPGQCNTAILIMACDGVWDVVTDAQAGQLVSSILEAGGTCQVAAERLRDLSYCLGSDDNISVIVSHILL